MGLNPMCGKSLQIPPKEKRLLVCRAWENFSLEPVICLPTTPNRLLRRSFRRKSPVFPAIPASVVGKAGKLKGCRLNTLPERKLSLPGKTEMKRIKGHDFDTPFDPDVIDAEYLALLGPTISPSDLPPNLFADWKERSAIMEYDGGIPRERAEARALEEILANLKQEGRMGRG